MRLSYIALAIAISWPFHAFASPRNSAEIIFQSKVLKAITENTLSKDSKLPFAIYYRGKVNPGFLQLRERELLSAKAIARLGDNKFQIKLFRGHLKRIFKSGYHVAASVIGSKLTVSFTNGRDIYSATANLLEASNGHLSSASLQKVPNFIKVDSGEVIPSLVATTGDENSTPSTMAASGLTTSYLIELSAITDPEYVTLKGGSTQAFSQILSTINTADTIYASQLDAEFSVVNQDTVPSNTLTSTDSTTLLTTFMDYENINDTSSRDDTHLFTGKNLDGSTIGLAFLGVMCKSSTFSYGLTKMKSNEALSGLTFAHEVGHNLDASHDSTTPSLMSPTISASHTSFSALSLSEINSFLASNSSCLVQSNGGNGSSNYNFGKIKIKKSGNFKLIANILSGDPSSCTISVYGASKQGKLSTAKYSTKGTLITAFSGALGNTKLTASGLPNKLKKTHSVYFRLFTDCGDDDTSLSDIKGVELQDGGTVGAPAWINLLQSSQIEAQSK